MASGHIRRLANVFNRVYNSRNIKQCRAGIVVSSQNKSTIRGPSIDDNSHVEIAVTSDGNTIVCYHPSEDVPYELTQPLVRPDAISDHAETHEQVLKARLGKEVLNNKQAPTIEELSKMFYTTKHRWYPVGQYHTRRRNPNPPKDR
ncbi:39S ribosomal protein L42, mitochondrial isoform X1 [Pseudorasbora parva]|uniref:39S ribosomal protein L42, mitochondrial isoform X1 n=1 Tax=Pseudorasbora parva TaxID=51549 RepID=UPI00351E76A5